MTSAIASQSDTSSLINASKEEVSQIQLYAPKENNLFSVRTDARIKIDKEVVIIMKASKDCDCNDALENKIIFPTIRSLCATKAIVVHEPKNEDDFNETIKKVSIIFNKKIKTIILCGHSSDGDSVTFQKNFDFQAKHWKYDTTVCIKDSNEGGSVFIIACETGLPYRIAQQLSIKISVPVSAPTGGIDVRTTFFLDNKAIFFTDFFHGTRDLSSIMATSWFLLGRNITPDSKLLDVISNNNPPFIKALQSNDLDLAYSINKQLANAYFAIFGSQPVFNGHAHLRQYDQYYAYKCHLRVKMEAKLRELSSHVSKKKNEKRQAYDPRVIENLRQEIQTLTQEMSELSSRIEILNKSASGEQIFQRLKSEMIETRYASKRFIIINSKEDSSLESKKILKLFSRVQTYLNLLSLDNSLQNLAVIGFMQRKLNFLSKLFRIRVECLEDKIVVLEKKLKKSDENQQKEKTPSLINNKRKILSDVMTVQDSVSHLQEMLNNDQPSMSPAAMAASV
ncbi:MAG: hypothetical protein PVI40_05825 [Chlamydiota bacterium]|jgi:hypothetical protein